MPNLEIDINVYHKYEKESSKLRMIPGGAWTINLSTLNIENICTFIYETKTYIYIISYKDALKNGQKMVLGGELKLVVPLKYWEKIKKEKRNG